MSSLLARILTRSFPGNRDEPETRLELAPAAPAPVNDYDSRAFASWFDHLEQGSGQRILDIGPARPRNISFLRGAGYDLGIMGLRGESPLTHARAFGGDGDSYVAALCWDVPNYCANEDEFAGFGDWLAARLRPGSPVHVALATQAPYSDQPSRYDIIDKDRLSLGVPSCSHSRSVVFSNAKLPRLWSAFEVKRSFLMRSGWQEHVLRRV